VLDGDEQYILPFLLRDPTSLNEGCYMNECRTIKSITQIVATVIVSNTCFWSCFVKSLD
jgi:hypothetical protein